MRQSRKLWDNARSQGAPTTALFRAILYELQPVRFSSIDVHSIGKRFRLAWQHTHHFLAATMVNAWKMGSIVLHQSKREHWMIVGGVIIYYLFVRFIHNVLDAGPIVLMTTALVGIFTVGLGDDDDDREGRVSAYSVFNRGFQRILGSVDAESLLQQHVGGAMGMAGMGMNMMPQVRNDHAVPQNPRPEANIPPAAQPNNDGQQQQQQQQQQQEERDENLAQQNRSRKSGKRARRRNLEQRREIQRQRQAAMAMGFGGDATQDEMMAMQLLLEEQIAAQNAR